MMSMSFVRFTDSYVNEVPQAGQKVRHAFVGVRYRFGLPRVHTKVSLGTAMNATA